MPHGVPGPLRNRDGEIARPVRPEIQIGAPRPLADAAHPPLDDRESAGSPSQPLGLLGRDGPVGLAVPQAEARFAGLPLEAEKVGPAELVRVAGVDQGKTRDNEVARQIGRARLAVQDHDGGRPAPAVGACPEGRRLRVLPGVFAQALDGAAALARLGREADPRKLGQAAGSEADLALVGDGQDPVGAGRRVARRAGPPPGAVLRRGRRQGPCRGDRDAKREPSHDRA